MNALKRLSRALLASLMCGVVILIGSVSPVAHAASGDKEPYFKVYGGSVFTGGAFSTKGATGCATNYQYSTSSSGSKGGIYTFAKQNGSSTYVGASTQYDAYATGGIEAGSADHGFFTAGNTAQTNKNYLTFANSTAATGSGAWGGYFDGSVPQSDCIPDYYDDNLPASAPSFTGNTITGSLSGSYKASGTPFTLNASTISDGQKVAIFVNGDVYINGNITYPASYTNEPKFVLVAVGNIYVSNSVTQLDGFYVAQPKTPADTTAGSLWSCYDTSQAPGVAEKASGWGQWVASNCGQTLTINGAIVAQQVNFMRVKGDLANANPSEDGGVTNAQTSNNVAEIINYNPNMVIGGGFFTQSSTTYKVDSLVSLPPVF